MMLDISASCKPSKLTAAGVLQYIAAAFVLLFNCLVIAEEPRQGRRTSGSCDGRLQSYFGALFGDDCISVLSSNYAKAIHFRLATLRQRNGKTRPLTNRIEELLFMRFVKLHPLLPLQVHDKRFKSLAY